MWFEIDYLSFIVGMNVETQQILVLEKKQSFLRMWLKSKTGCGEAWGPILCSLSQRQSLFVTQNNVYQLLVKAQLLKIFPFILNICSIVYYFSFYLKKLLLS